MKILRKESVDYLIIHHSTRMIDSSWLIRLRHRWLRRWEEIGYHYILGNGLISREGEIYKGRPSNYQGAHCYGYNARSLGICLIGNLDRYRPGFRQLRSLVRLLRQLMAEYGISADRVLGHNETEGCQKSCPGVCLAMDRIRKIL